MRETTDIPSAIFFWLRSVFGGTSGSGYANRTPFSSLYTRENVCPLCEEEEEEKGQEAEEEERIA